MDFDPINPFGAPPGPQPMFPSIKGPGAVGPPVDIEAVQKFGTIDNDNES